MRKHESFLRCGELRRRILGFIFWRLFPDKKKTIRQAVATWRTPDRHDPTQFVFPLFFRKSKKQFFSCLKRYYLHAKTIGCARIWRYRGGEKVESSPPPLPSKFKGSFPNFFLLVKSGSSIIHCRWLQMWVKSLFFYWEQNDSTWNWSLKRETRQ